MISTSRMSGTSRIVVLPSASRAAAISLSAQFFAPVTRTSPASRAPPATRKRSTVPAYGRLAQAQGHRVGRHRVGHVVNLTRIYTRTGDAGTTALGDLSRTSKTDLRLAAYADVDEANSCIGVALALGGLPEPVH